MSRSRVTLALAGAALFGVLALVAFPRLLAGPLSSGFAALAGAERWWLLLAAAGFVGAFACTVAAWRAALAAAGGRIATLQAGARLGVGAMVNSFAPARLGDAVKVALCARAVEADSKLGTIGGAYAALAAARSLALASLVVAASAIGAMPIWPVFALCGLAGVLALVATLSLRVRSHSRVAQLLQGLAALERSPRSFAVVAAWTFAMVIAQLAATVAVAGALGLPHPLTAAFVILPALEVASALPVTPGSIGIGSGAVAVALASRGIGMGDALGVGLAMQGLQTLVSVTVGTLGAVYLFDPGPVARRWLVRAVTVGGSAVFAAGLSVLVAQLV